MKTKVFNYLGMMLLASISFISCNDEESIAPIERGEKVLIRMEQQYWDTNKKKKYIKTTTYSYDSNNNISSINVSDPNKESSWSYNVDGDRLTSDKYGVVEYKLNNAKYIEEFTDHSYSSGSSFKFNYHSSGYLKTSFLIGGNYEQVMFEPIYDKQWRITDNTKGNLKSFECIWSDIPNKGNLFLWDIVNPGTLFYNYITHDEDVIILANAGLYGKAQAFLPKRISDDTESLDYTGYEFEYELDKDGYVTQATMMSVNAPEYDKKVVAIFKFTYE